jgi:F-type H+-transporting ATPase subunit b
MLSAGIGTIIWTSVAFLVVLFLLKKLAWGPILSGLKERETSIENALRQADQAREEMARLNNENAKIIEQARIEQDRIIAEAKTIREKMISDAKADAEAAGKKLAEDARVAIEAEKNAALREVKNMVANLSVDIAEKVLREKFADRSAQESFVNRELDNVKLN